MLNWNPNGSLGSLAITDGFNSGGSVTCVSNSTGFLSYGYDDWERLNEFDCGSGNFGEQYAYDFYDNLTKTVPSNRTGFTWSPGYSTTNNHCTGCTYDSDGNVIGDGNNVYQWNEFSMMKTAATTGTPTCGTSGHCNTYDAFGRVVEYTSGTTYREWWLTQAGTINMSGATPEFGYFPAPMGGIVIVTANSGSYYYNHPDWFGNTRLTSNLGTNAYVTDQAHAPYGDVFNQFGSTNSQYNQFAGTASDFYTGVLYDTPNRELATYGRWLSPDPAGTGWNQYAYPTNPNSETDPSGLCPWCGGGGGGGSVYSSITGNCGGGDMLPAPCGAVGGVSNNCSIDGGVAGPCSLALGTPTLSTQFGLALCSGGCGTHYDWQWKTPVFAVSVTCDDSGCAAGPMYVKSPGGWQLVGSDANNGLDPNSTLGWTWNFTKSFFSGVLNGARQPGQSLGECMNQNVTNMTGGTVDPKGLFNQSLQQVEGAAVFLSIAQVPASTAAGRVMVPVGPLMVGQIAQVLVGRAAAPYVMRAAAGSLTAVSVAGAATVGTAIGSAINCR